MKNLREIFRLPKRAKIALMTLSAVAVVLLISSFALQKWADSQVESANLVLTKIDKNKSESLNGVFAYEARVHFERLDFLLRSRTISHIELQSISWVNGIDSSAIQSIETHNRRLNFTTTQNLLDSLDSGANLGVMSFKMDFSALPKAIIKYYLLIMIFASVALFFCKIFKNEIARFLSLLNQDSFPQVLWNGYKNINPLYRHTFWIVFIACNVVFGFHTIHFLWGNHDWGAVFGGYGMFAEKYTGRYTQNIISMFLQGEKLLPILNNVLAFAGIALASVLLCAYLSLPKKLYIWVIVGFMLTLTPFTLTRMYYAMQIAGLFIAVAIGILGFVLAKKAGESSTNRVNLAQVGGGQSQIL